MRERWPMRAEDRERIVDRLFDIVRGKSTIVAGVAVPPTIREITSAAKALISADRLNLQERQLREQAEADAVAADPIDPDVAARLLKAALDPDDDGLEREPRGGRARPDPGDAARDP